MDFYERVMWMTPSNGLYYYKVYGLNIASEIELSELITLSQKDHIDVYIIRKTMSDEIKAAQRNNIHFQFLANDIWYEIEDLGTFHAKEGRIIEVDCAEDKDPQLVKGYLLGTAFSCIMAQREQITIHGGTIVINHKAIIFTGDSGAGKSTLTTTLRNQGYGFLADDVSVTALNNLERFIVQPAYPQQKLCHDTMTQLGYTPSNYVKIDEERDKYLLPVKDQFIFQPMPLGGLVEISIGTGPHVELIEIKGKEKLKILFRNIYRQSIWSYLPMPTHYFKQCMLFVQQIPIYKLQRPAEKYTVDEQIKQLLKTIQKQGVEQII